MTITSTGVRRPAAHVAPRLRLAAAPFWLRSLALALLAAGALLWPLPARLHTHALDLGDGLHLAWVLRQAQENMLTPGAGFAAPAGFPYGSTLLLNPPLYAAALLTLPLYAVGWSATAVYNAATLLSFALACWALMLLGRRLTGSAAAGLAAGLVYAFADVRLAHIAHLNLLSGFWTALLLGLLLGAWREPPRTRRGLAALALGAGLLAAAQALGDVYNAIYMAAAATLLGAAWAGWLAAGRAGRRAAEHLRALAALAAGAALAVALVAPVLLPTLGAWRELGVERAWADHERLAARPEHYLVAAHGRPLYDLSDLGGRGIVADPVEQRLWPGAAAVALAAVGLLAGPRELRRERLLLGALGLAALALSLGPSAELAGRDVALPWYRWLFDHAPLLSAARAPARWALLLQLALAALAAIGAARALGLGRGGLARAALTAALLAVVLLDVRPPAPSLTDDLVGEPTPDVYRALAGLPEGALLEWPLENASATLKHRQQHYTLAHGRPIVNSAASAPPPRLAQIHAYLRGFPEGATVPFLRDIGVRYVVVSRWEIGGWAELGPRLAAAPGLRLVGTYEAGRHLLYEVLADQPAPPAPAGVVSAGPEGPRLTVAAAAPVWVREPAALYAGDSDTPVALRLADGREVRAALRLPPVILPGAHSWPLPAAAAGAVELELAGVRIPLTAPPVMAGDEPWLAAGPLPAHLAPGDTLPCLAFGRLPARPGLVLAAAIVDGRWNLAAKADHFLGGRGAGEAVLGCGLALPADLPAGEYFLALGLYDPSSGAFVPVMGRDGARSEGLLRVAGPLQVST